MKILVVNDDSISAPGIALLAQVAAEFADVWLVAPAEQCSALSQKLTLRDPISLEKVTDFPAPVAAAWKLGGTPVDCVKVALEYLMEEKPDWVFSGINNGYNAGYDIAYSATLGAAFEAARNGIPAIAFSIVGDAHLSDAQQWLRTVIRELLMEKLGAGMVWNVNFPAIKKSGVQGILRNRTVAPCSMYRETYIETLLPDGRKALLCKGIPTPDAQIPEGTDAAAVRAGYISIGNVKCGVM